jgi:hypothetical protein
LKPKGIPRDKYNLSGIYQLQCGECPIKYVGETGRPFKVNYREHINVVRTNKHHDSKFAQLILETGHTYNTMDQAMEILHTVSMGPRLNTLERYYIYDITKKGLQMNDTFTDTYNHIFGIPSNKHTKQLHTSSILSTTHSIPSPFPHTTQHYANTHTDRYLPNKQSRPVHTKSLQHNDSIIIGRCHTHTP